MLTRDGSSHPRGPAIRAADPWLPWGPEGRLHQLLSEEERAQLATIASIVDFKKGEAIYSEGQAAAALFNVTRGMVKAYRTNGDGSEHISAFFYPEDLFGLSQGGRYTTSARALTPVTAYLLPVPALRQLLLQDAALEFHVIAKLYHDMRQVHDHARLLAQKHAVSKLAIFLQLEEHLQAARGESTAEIYLPMHRSDIAKYVGMSLAAVSRGFAALATKRIIKTTDRRHVQIIDRHAFEKLVSCANGSADPSPATK